MSVTNYYTVNGSIIGESTNGVRTDYLTDALGSVTATVDQTGTVQNTYRYKPYGDLLAKTGSGIDPKFLWVGTLGYRATGLQVSSHYVRARHYSDSTGMWTTVDPLWPDEPQYGYAGASPSEVVDPTGLVSLPCLAACLGAAACFAAAANACREWESLGFPSWSSCMVETLRNLPTYSKIVCSIGLAGCIACLSVPPPAPPVGRPRPLPGPSPLPPPTGGPQPLPGPTPGPLPVPVPPHPVPFPPLPQPCPDPKGSGCSESERESLQNEVIRFCKTGSSSCKPYMAYPPNKSRCADIMLRAQQNLNCARARAAINVRCFKGGDAGHTIGTINAVAAWRTCLQAMKYNSCA